ncbi:siderophore-interacting protein [Streptomyces flavofungini]|uniref:Siderophore-interacting protein n=1 Tax=Streptomyces flavofungini TaxID=68200 RepID=A0ABS0XI53_9ACTN|nr:siderophore-interacting protein [Streptomyces flavofungini]MBJ3812873.1 siderophore-interacting protein [Streptomyces flavofungini]GHC79830.1 siderophore-interacting protein [Streptomyces flavofungini]
MTDAPFRFFDAQVLRTERLTPSMVRVAFGGSDVARMASGGRGQRVKVFLPQPGQSAPVMPDTDSPDWYAAWRELDPDVRGIMRTYTIRELRRDPHELIVDFAVHAPAPDAHSPEGPASRWARTARPGTSVGVLAPVAEENAAYDFRPPEDTDWILLTGDESALPAVAGILEALPPSTRVLAWLELHDPADRQELPTKADADITWLTGEGTTTAAIRTADLPTGAPYAWIAGESATVKAVRRHLVTDRGFDRTRVKFTGYWREGATEDQLLSHGEDA